MATLNSTMLSLADHAARLDPEGKISKIAEVLNEQNEILNDMVFVEANGVASHKLTIRTGLPTATWRKLNYGVSRSKSRTAQVMDTLGMLETYSVVDCDLAKMSGNLADFRFSEDIAFLEGMNQQMATQLFYGDIELNPERIHGFANRYDDTDVSSGDNIIDGGGTGTDDNTSIWLILWGPNTCFGTFPKGSKAGLQFSDKGQQTVLDSDDNEYEAFRSHYKWDMGISVKDWRYAVRIANVDVSALTKDASAGADLIDLMVQATEKIRNSNMGRGAFYCNQTIRSFLRRQMREAGKYNLSWDMIEGKRVLNFDEYPVRRTDALVNTESAVSFS